MSDSQTDANSDGRMHVRIGPPENKNGPFLWQHPANFPAEMCAPDGWYIWTKSGLKYLGLSPAMGDETP